MTRQHGEVLAPATRNIFTILKNSAARAQAPREGWAVAHKHRSSRQEAPSLEALSSEEQATLAARWRQDGLDEHAAVATYARFTMQLLALGAPPELVRAAQRASLDEVSHAQLCLDMARHYGAGAVEPSPLSVEDEVSPPTDPAVVVHQAVVDGCVGESIRAAWATMAADACRDPVVERALRRIAVDETRHAGLAFRFVGWALAQPRFTGIREAVEEALEASIAAHALPPAVDGREEAAPHPLAAHGLLDEAARQAIAGRTLAEVVLPCVRALGDGHQSR